MVRRIINKFRKALFNASHLEDLLDRSSRQATNDINREIRCELVKREYERLFLTNDTKGVTETLHGGKRIIVSLTSYGQRIHDVYLVIESMMQQTLKPNKILLWLAEEEFTTEAIPASLRKLEERGLEIKFCEDLKSYNKLVPTLRQYPDDIVITIDDDVIYPIDLIDRLYKQHLLHPKDVICTHAHIIEFSLDGKPVPYVQWIDPPTDRSRESLSFLPLGIGGVLYPPHSLHPDVFDKSRFRELAPTADDLWFKFMALKNGVSSRTTPIYEDFNSWIVSINRKNSPCLFDINMTANDKQFENLLNEFGYDNFSFEERQTKH